MGPWSYLVFGKELFADCSLSSVLSIRPLSIVPAQRLQAGWSFCGPQVVRLRRSFRTGRDTFRSRSYGSPPAVFREWTIVTVLVSVPPVGVKNHSSVK